MFDQPRIDERRSLPSQADSSSTSLTDIKSFFEELVKEGRPAPSPEVLSKLLELFAMDRPRL